VYVIALYPLLCRRFEEGRERFSLIYSEAARIMTLAVLPLAILFSMQASNIVMLLGGERFEAASAVTQVLIWAMVGTFFSQLALRGCMAAKQERSIPYVTGTALAVNVLANLVLVPHWQAVGAAIAAMLCQLVAFLLFTVLLARHVNLLRTSSIVLRVVLGNLPALAFLLWQHQASLLLLIPVFVALIIGGCVITRTLSLKDVSMVGHILLTRKSKASSEEGATSDQPTLIVPKIDEVVNRKTAINP